MPPDVSLLLIVAAFPRDSRKDGQKHRPLAKTNKNQIPSPSMSLFLLSPHPPRINHHACLARKYFKCCMYCETIRLNSAFMM